MADSIFCRWMIKTVENPQGTDCSAHLCEGHIFECPFDNSHHAQTAKYSCMDYEPLVQLEVA